jgi:hypothetical protein
MLSSSPPLLLSALSPLSTAGDASATAGNAAPGFAELLNGLAAKAGEAPAGEDTEQVATGAKGKTLTERERRLTVAVKDLTVTAQALAAIESGKILPVGLPEAAEAGGKGEAEAEAVVADTTAPSPLSIVPAPLVQTGEVPVRATGTAARRTAAATQQVSTDKVNVAPGQPADRTRPDAQTTEGRSAPAVAITVAAPAQIAALAGDTADTKPVAAVRSKPARAADLVRIEASQGSPPPPAATAFLHADPAAPAANTPALNMPGPMPSPTDIDAALDHLFAAREALMPAEASLAIDHADFGEVSIKFEQSPDGQLSAELTAADPDLKRVVNAAVAADRGSAMTSDGDGGRSAQLASHRGSTAGGDAASGERGQSGTDRDLPQRRTPARSPARQAATDQRPGVFA